MKDAPDERSTARLSGWPSDRRLGGVRAGGAFVWLLFILFPLIDAVENRGPTLRHVLAIVGAGGLRGGLCGGRARVAGVPSRRAAHSS